MNRPLLARTWFGLTALAVLVGLVVQVSVSARLKGTQFTTTTGLVVNVFCYFTVQSNILAGATSGLLAAAPDRASTMFRVLRLAGLVGITVTGVVFHLALSGLQDLQGAAAAADLLLHTVVPLLTVLGWLVFGPRRQLSWRVARLSLLFPVLWSVLALVRGALIGFYPYPFIDVGVLGYPRVALNILAVGVLFFALASAAVLLDRRLERDSR